MIAAFLGAAWGVACWLFSLLKAVGGLCWVVKIGVAFGAWALRGGRAGRVARAEGGA